MDECEIAQGWLCIFDAMLMETDAPDGLLAELEQYDKARHDRFIQWLLSIGCAEVVHLPGQAH